MTTGVVESANFVNTILKEYRGQRLCDIPESALRWLANKCNAADHAEAATAYLVEIDEARAEKQAQKHPNFVLHVSGETGRVWYAPDQSRTRLETKEGWERYRVWKAGLNAEAYHEHLNIVRLAKNPNVKAPAKLTAPIESVAVREALPEIPELDFPEETAA